MEHLLQHAMSASSSFTPHVVTESSGYNILSSTWFSSYSLVLHGSRSNKLYHTYVWATISELHNPEACKYTLWYVQNQRICLTTHFWGHLPFFLYIYATNLWITFWSGSLGMWHLYRQKFTCRAREVAQPIKCVPSKRAALNSNPRTHGGLGWPRQEDTWGLQASQSHQLRTLGSKNCVED